jgi:hypothetical protein
VRFLYYVENVLILSLFLNENTVLILKKLEYEACNYLIGKLFSSLMLRDCNKTA